MTFNPLPPTANYTVIGGSRIWSWYQPNFLPNAGNERASIHPQKLIAIFPNMTFFYRSYKSLSSNLTISCSYSGYNFSQL